MIALFIMLSAELCLAQSGHLTVLTVTTDLINQTVGGTADLYLDIRPGTGRIFIDSLPLTKIDTQISTRVANEIACDFLRKDCSKYDFFYRIRTDSSMIGGPSAGAAISVLTASLLDNRVINEKITITGTINSGGIIGAVGGVEDKIRAADESRIKTVLIPKWDIPDFEFNITNQTIVSEETGINRSIMNSTLVAVKKNLSAIFSNSSIEIVRVGNLADALFYFTGKDYNPKAPEIIVPAEYSARMKKVSEELCGRTVSLRSELLSANASEDSSEKSNLTAVLRKADNLKELASNATAKGKYYSAASYCFTANIVLQQEIFNTISKNRLRREYLKAMREVEEFETGLDSRSLRTISDLEVYMLVKERVVEAKALLESQEDNNLSRRDISYAYERFRSGVSWSQFFGFEGQKFNLDNEYLMAGCYKKIEETEERINYLSLFFPKAKDSFKDELLAAYRYSSEKNYKLCMFKASNVKARVNSVISSFYLERETVGSYIDEQLRATKMLIIKEQANGFFPILGYSYYEYADDLKGHDQGSGILFSEYALELSYIDRYFPQNSGISLHIEKSQILIFLSGMCLGMLIVLLVLGRARFSPGKKKKKA